MKIINLNPLLSVRLYNVLTRVGLDNTEEIERIPAKYLRRIQNMGQRSYDELAERVPSIKGSPNIDPDEQEFRVRNIVKVHGGYEIHCVFEEGSYEEIFHKIENLSSKSKEEVK